MEATRVKAALLLLLALQIGCQPLLMGWFVRQVPDVKLCVGVVEMLKLVLALVPLAVSGRLGAELRGWRLATALQTTAAPAFIYVVQNYLNQSAAVLLDGVTFNVLNQTKIIWTAVLVYWMLGRAQSRVQVLALAILCAAAVVMTLPAPTVAPGGSSNDSEADSESRVDDTDAAFVSGAYQAMTAAVLSALAGTIIQRALQMQQRNTYMVTVELSVLGQLTLGLWAIGASLWSSSVLGDASKPRNGDAGFHSGTSLNDTDSDASPGIWAGWTAMTVVALLCQAVGGITVGFVIKHCGNVQKSFAVVLGMIISAGLEHVCNGKPLGIEMAAAIGMVALSTFLYVTNPPKRAVPDSGSLQVEKIDAPPQLFCVSWRFSRARPANKPDSTTYIKVCTEEVTEADIEEAATMESGVMVAVKCVDDSMPKAEGIEVSRVVVVPS